MVLFPIITNKLMFVGHYKVAGDDKTWIGYFGSFWGAIVGGVISGVLTLLGVQLTIKHNNDLKKREEYPEKLFRLETLMTYLEKRNNDFDRLLALDFGEKKNVFFEIDENYQLIKTQIYFKYTDQLLETINKDIVYVDSKAYRMFFETRKKVNDLYQELMWEPEYSLFNFTDELIEKENKKGNDVVNINWTEFSLDREQEKKLSSIRKNLYKNERKLIFHQSEIVRDLSFQLEQHYMELIEEINY